MTIDTQATETQQQQEKIFESSRVVNSPDGWISVNGVFYSCAPNEHDVCAEYLYKTKKLFIESLLIKQEEDQMISSGPELEHTSREILIAAGFALLSNSQLSESNLPKNLSLKQMVFANRNKLIFTPKSGELDLDSYLAFKESIKNLDSLKELLSSYRPDDDELSLAKEFLSNPMKTLHIREEESFTNRFVKVITENSTAQISLKLGKGEITWNKLNIPSPEEIFLQYEFHDHTGGGQWESSPRNESTISLVNKQSVKEYLDKKIKHEFSPEGDLSILD